MKNQKINSVKNVSKVMLIVTMLALSACADLRENTAETNDTSEITSTVKPPKMDIHAAAFMGNLEAVHQHINAGTDLNGKEPLGGSSPLITATVFGKTEVAKALIKAGVDLNLKNNEGSTALHSAAFFCHVEIVEALLASKADKTLKNNAGATPFETVAGSFEKVKGIYDFIGKQLGPMGFKLDYDHLEITRPVIAEMLK